MYSRSMKNVYVGLPVRRLASTCFYNRQEMDTIQVHFTHSFNYIVVHGLWRACFKEFAGKNMARGSVKKECIAIRHKECRKSTICLRVNKTSTRRVEIDEAHAASEFETLMISLTPTFPHHRVPGSI
jgi:hypothetical protein